MIDSI